MNGKKLNNLAYARKLSRRKRSEGKIAACLLAAGILFLSGCGRENISGNDLSKNDALKAGDSESIEREKIKPVKILFVGDMMFDRYVRQAVGKYGKGDYDYTLEPVKNKLAKYDLVVGNLEGPIMGKVSTSVGTAMDEKRNLVFTFDPAVAKTLAENNIKLVNLGNNHILNQGEDGLAQTKKYLNEAGVQYFGDTGNDENSDLVKNIGGAEIGFVSYNYSMENSFAGAIEDIKSVRKRADVVVVCPHWGTEYKIGDPGPAVRDMARKFIDAGADAVIGTHPHVVQMSETHKGRKIYFSLGNFVFDQYFQKETMEGLGVEMRIAPDLSIAFGELKFKMTKKGQTIF